MTNYQEEKQILPAPNGSEPVIVTFDMAFSQLVDLVSYYLACSNHFLSVVVS